MEPFCGLTYDFNGKTTTNVCEDVVKVLTKQHQCSLCGLLKALNHNRVYVAEIRPSKFDPKNSAIIGIKPRGRIFGVEKIRGRK